MLMKMNKICLVMLLVFSSRRSHIIVLKCYDIVLLLIDTIDLQTINTDVMFNWKQ